MSARIGIINIMPRGEAYEPYLLAPLRAQPIPVEPVWIRLASHAYHSADPAHLEANYRTFEDVIATAPLDGLILTGAPVEELAFSEVRYFDELSAILRYARAHVPVTLGLCWGGMALGHLLGVGKRLFSKKLFGVFEERIVVPNDLTSGDAFLCAHSRHSGVVEADLERAVTDGVVRALSRGDHSGSSLFESIDRRYIAHLGHPEYEADRIVFEWERDRQLGRADVNPPAGFDLTAPSTTWASHRAQLFAGFVRRATLADGL